MFEPHGLNGGGNWIITSDEEGRIKQYDLRKWEVSRVIYDSELVHRNDDYGGEREREICGSEFQLLHSFH